MLKINRTTHPGFTLIELIVVITLIGILSAVSISRFSTSPNVDALTNRIATDIRYTQSLGLTHSYPGLNYFIQFSSGSNSYSIITNGGQDDGGFYMRAPGSGTLVSGQLWAISTQGATLTLANMPNRLISFDALGIPYNDMTNSTLLTVNATITVTMNNKSRTITIYPITGLVEIS